MKSKYSCINCGKSFTQKSHYDSHMKSKKPCDNNTDKIKKMIDDGIKKALNDMNINGLGNTIQIHTFKELYNFLQSYTNKDIFSWLDVPWEGKDKLESLLRLFSGLGLIEKLNNYSRCKGNFNLKTIHQMSSIKDIFYNESNNLIKLKDKGDSSDLTCIHKNDNKHLLVTTSKNLKNVNVGKLDIEKILIYVSEYEKNGFTITWCI